MSRKLLAGWLLICMGVSTMLLGWTMTSKAQAASEPYETAAGTHDEMIRIHVIANSDSPEDQALKLKVRDAVLAELAPRLQGAATVEEAEAVVMDALMSLQGVSAGVIEHQGFDYGVRAELGRFAFPGKSYGDLYLPAGEYKALRVVIGEGKGANFWCLVFPTLCYNIREFKRNASGSSTPTGGGATNRW